MPDLPKLSAKALRERRAPLAVRIREVAETVNGANDGAGREFTAEEKANWEQLNNDYNALSRQIDLAERAEAVTAQQNERVQLIDPPTPATPLPGNDVSPQLAEEHRAMLLGAWARAGRGRPLGAIETELCQRTGFNPHADSFEVPLYSTGDFRAFQRRFRSVHPSSAVERMTDFRASTLSGQSGTLGGYTVVPETLIRSLEINMLAFGGLLQVADTITTATGERMSWPTADDTSHKGRRVGESPTLTTTSQPAFAKIFWDAYKYTSDALLVPYELLQDSVFQLPEILGAMLGERLGRILNDECTTGTGAGQPKGIVTAAALGVTAASQTAIAADEIIRLEHAVDPAYRAGAGYMCHDSVLLALRLLKDGMGRYLWQSGFNTGSPDTLNARPLTINQSMASSIITTAKTLLFGQMPKYKVRRVSGVRLYRLEERYRDNDQDGFLAFLRADGNLLDAGTHPIVYLQQA